MATSTDLRIQLFTPTSVTCDEDVTCVIVFNSLVPINDEICVRFSNPNIPKNVFVPCQRINSTTVTLKVPKNFPKGKAEISVHIGLGETLLCKSNETFEFKSKIEYIYTLLECIVEPISFLSSVFGKTDSDVGAVDAKLSLMFKERLPTSLKSLKCPQLGGVFLKDQIISLKNPTLMHFGARFNFVKLCAALLECPGSDEALKIVNCDGLTPCSLAASLGNLDLAKMLEVNDVYELMSSYIGGNGAEDETYMDMESTFVNDFSAINNNKELPVKIQDLADNLSECNLINSTAVEKTSPSPPGQEYIIPKKSTDRYRYTKPLPKQHSMPNMYRVYDRSSPGSEYKCGITDISELEKNDDYVDLLGNMGEGNNEGVYDIVPSFNGNQCIHDSVSPEETENLYDVPPVNPLNNYQVPPKHFDDNTYETSHVQPLGEGDDQITANIRLPPRCPVDKKIDVLPPNVNRNNSSFAEPEQEPPFDNNDIYDIPPVPNQYNEDVYDTVPARDNVYDIPPTMNNIIYDVPPVHSREIYDVPPTLNSNDIYSAYDVPPSLNTKCSEVYDVLPKEKENDCIYDIPSNNSEVYDTLPSYPKQLYDSPPKKGRHIYDVPPIKNIQATCDNSPGKSKVARPLPKLPSQSSIGNSQYFNMPSGGCTNQTSPTSTSHRLVNVNSQFSVKKSPIKSERHGKPMPTPPELPKTAVPPPILPRERIVLHNKPVKPSIKPRK